MRTISCLSADNPLSFLLPRTTRTAGSARATQWSEAAEPPGSMPTSGDTVDLDLGVPDGREAGVRHPAVLVTAQRVLDAAPSVVHVVPLTSAIRQFHSEIVIEPDLANGLQEVSAAQCQHLRAVSPVRIVTTTRQCRPLRARTAS